MSLLLDAIGKLFKSLTNRSPAPSANPSGTSTSHTTNGDGSTSSAVPGSEDTVSTDNSDAVHQGRTDIVANEPRADSLVGPEESIIPYFAVLSRENGAQLIRAEAENRRLQLEHQNNRLDWELAKDKYEAEIKFFKALVDKQRIRAADAEGRANWMKIETRRADEAEEKVRQLEDHITSLHEKIDTERMKSTKAQDELKKVQEKCENKDRMIDYLDLELETEKAGMFTMLQRKDQDKAKVVRKYQASQDLILRLQVELHKLRTAPEAKFSI